MTNENRIKLAEQVKAILAHRYDLPELLSAQVSIAPNAAQTAIARTSVGVRGQMAAIVRKLDVEVQVQVLVKDDAKKPQVWADLSYHYTHVGGGSNGFTVHYVAGHTTSFDYDLDENATNITDVVEIGLFRQVQDVLGE